MHYQEVTKSDSSRVVIRLLLKPIARLCIKRNIRIPQIVETLKESLIEVARDELERTNSSTSDSKISLMTGVHRKDVSRLQNGLPTTEKQNLLTQVIGLWITSDKYSYRKKPKPLSCKGVNSQFFELVSDVNKELSPYTVLFELQRMGFIEHKNSQIELKVTEYIPNKNLSSFFSIAAKDVEDIIQIVEHNLTEQDCPALHLRTSFDKVDQRKELQIKNWLLKEGKKFHDKARNYISKYDFDVNPVESKSIETIAVSIGTFGITKLNNQ